MFARKRFVRGFVFRRTRNFCVSRFVLHFWLEARTRNAKERPLVVGARLRYSRTYGIRFNIGPAGKRLKRFEATLKRLLK